jgi:hypothetical protein
VPAIVVRETQPEPIPVNARDFRIIEVHRIGQGSLHEKARDNLAAIRMLTSVLGRSDPLELG